MKNTKIKIILSAIIFLSVAGFAGTAAAAGSSVYVSPASLTKTVGDIFNVSVGVSTSGSKVCAVEGTLVFNNLSCQSITVDGNVTPQSVPTCSNPYFLIGVPSCSTADKVLFAVSAKAGSTGAASISFTGIDIIGEGVSVGTASVSGNYTINAILTATLTPAPTATPKTASTATPTPKTTPKPTVLPTSTPTPVSSEQPAISAPTPTPTTQVAANEQPPERSLFLASISSALTLGTGNIWVGLLILLIIGGIVYYFIQKERHKNLK
ncbi:hypothetical protein KKB43_00210 [Patescibacteria group bacterium]|nr:hypothetical protein [Patescibacteria group bacterium]MBU4579423.1 hypothetical protein [Patescibacteria group bacterium]